MKRMDERPMSFFEQLCLINRKITIFQFIYAEEYMNVHMSIIGVLKHSNVLDIFHQQMTSKRKAY